MNVFRGADSEIYGSEGLCSLGVQEGLVIRTFMEIILGKEKEKVREEKRSIIVPGKRESSVELLAAALGSGLD